MQSHLTAAVTIFVALEVINTVVNILPALRQTTAQAKRPYIIRTGIFSAVLVAALVIYLLASK